MIGFWVFLFKLEVFEFVSVIEIEAFNTNLFGFLVTNRISAREEVEEKWKHNRQSSQSMTKTNSREEYDEKKLLEGAHGPGFWVVFDVLENSELLGWKEAVEDVIATMSAREK